MIMTLLNWLWIGISSFFIGYGGVKILNKITCSSVHNVSIYWGLGLCGLITYAQYFSLIAKVGFLANVILFLGVVLVYVICRKEINALWGDALITIKSKGVRRKVFLLILVLLVGIVLLITSSPIRHYDTLLYHAQSIRWIEEYGIVKGLGNLHNRFAYNSSFFCLQALFGMPYIFGQSLHAVNGFCVCLFLIYSIVTLKCLKERKVYVSDCIRLISILCINFETFYKYVSSAGSDTLAILLFFYILIEFLTLAEQGNVNTSEYAYLCIIGVCAITVKLSVAMIVLIVIMPLAQLVQSHKWKNIGIFALTGFLVIFPYLLRNVIISGYLLYPYEKIDIFNVDWKMFSYTLEFDRNEIKACGRGYWNVLDAFNLKFSEWFPGWLSRLPMAFRWLFVMNILLLPVSLIWSLTKFIKNGKMEHLVVVMVIVSNLILWFWGAPLIRYGFPFLFLLPVYLLGNVLVQSIKSEIIMRKAVFCVVTLTICCNIGMTKYAYEQVMTDSIDILRMADYYEFDTVETSLDGVAVKVPLTGDQVGYYPFPSTPYSSMLNWIELRGKGLSEGFRIKEEYKGKFVPNNGEEQKNNVF